MRKRQVRFDAALTPDPEGLHDRPKFASGYCQLILEDVGIRGRRRAGDDASQFEIPSDAARAAPATCVERPDAIR